MKRSYLISVLFLSFFTLISCKKSRSYITDLDYKRIDLETHAPVDSEIENLIAPYKQKLSEEMDEVIAHTPIDLIKRRPNSTLGNWFADVLHIQAEKNSKSKVDFAAQNYGGLRIPSISKGPIQVGKIYELMPFDNALMILELDGATTKQFIETIAADGGWPISYGLQLTMDSNQKPKKILIQGEAFDANKRYKIALPDYVANGGGGCDFLKPFEGYNTGLFIRDVVIDYLRTSPSDQNIEVDSDKRIIIE